MGKSLKAVLTLNGVGFRKIHDLEQLAAETPDEVRAYLDNLDISWLTNWVITGRYPGDWPEATRVDAKKAVEIALDIYKYMETFCIQEIEQES